MKMRYNTIFARSFSQHEQKKMGFGALVACLLLAFTFCTVFKPYLGSLPVLNLRLSTGLGHKMLMIQDTSSLKPIDIRLNELMQPTTIQNMTPETTQHPRRGNETKRIHTSSLEPTVIKSKEMEQILCNMMEPRSDFCEINKDTRIHGKSSTVFIDYSFQNGISTARNSNSSWRIRPYARKTDATAMGNVREWSVKSITSHQEIPQCTLNHSVPAILFSLGGYAGNHFHDFTDVLIPLFLTSRQFNGQVQFLITNRKTWWTNKFRVILKNLSDYEIIDIDNEEIIHCFPSVIIGLKCHKELSIDPSKSPYYSMKDFTKFLRSSYSLKRSTTAIKMRAGRKRRRPRILIISRRKTRSFMNGDNIAKMAKTLGFKVFVVEADTTTNLSRFAQTVNSCDVVMGVHGAGLTNIVFLPQNAIFIQIVPLGGLEWLARFDFGQPANDMNIRYLEYPIKQEESTLIQQYPLNHVVFRDPFSFQKQGWDKFRSMYLDKQNVMLDVNRFRATLLEALELLLH